MSKIFRIYKEGPKTYQGWNENTAFPYTTTALVSIEDPDGASAKNEITSIPSPFARIDLVKTAFKEICRRASKDISELDGNTIFHKMVSDSLDVGEIFFNIDKFKNKIEIITWDPATARDVLLSDDNPGHYYVADVLQKYIESDASTYNFGKLNNIYLLNYKKGPDELNIIGATSPATLFFCGANNLDYVQDVYFTNNDKPFDEAFQPLYKRDFDYIKAWWVLRKTISGFSVLFPEVESYLNLTFRAISDHAIKSQLANITSASINDFSTIDVNSNQQTNQVEVLGNTLLKKKTGVSGDSQFTIKPEHEVNGIKPLILPVDSGNKYADLQYVNGKWGTDNKAPYIAPINDVDRRYLPFDGSVYPYLTISDFLEDTIVKVPHAINNKYYYNGNMEKTEERTSFLIPLKPLYFKYFSINTLNAVTPNGEKTFEMQLLAGGSVQVIVRIPINGNDNIKFIEYQRIYYAQRVADTTQNHGGMTSFDFTGFVMPGVKFQQEEDAYYIVSCVSTFSNNFVFRFYRNDQIIRDIPADCRNTEKGMHDYKAETYTITHSNFDFIQISKDGVENLIIPQFLTHQSLETFEFAVDLGTSNTHIEFKNHEDSGSQSMKFSETESILSTFFIPSYREIKGQKYALDLSDENDLIAADFIPFNVGGDSDFQFPSRTVLTYAKSANWTEKLRSFGLHNFCLTFNKRVLLPYNAKPLVNIKWSNEPNAQTAMQSYIRDIMLIIRNKVVANNGNIAKTKINWFFPSSMSPRRLSQLRVAWNESYSSLFNKQGTTYNISESVAPIQYYFRRYATATNLINVDIGGGTTDIAFSQNGKVNYITSFKFAANSLFEDSFSGYNPNNGIVDWFKEDILRLLQTKQECKDLVRIFNSNLDQPSNMASFLFSLKDNSATNSLDSNTIDFNRILQNDSKFKIVFILFYVAIIYHIAQIVKAKDIAMPRHIAFSGNGSKVISVISSDAKILSDFTKIIFEQVLGKKYTTALEILGLEHDTNPKESTCKGGLMPMSTDNDEAESVVLKDSSGNLVGLSDTYLSLNDIKKQQIVSSVKQFFNFSLSVLPSLIHFDRYFGVDDATIEIAKNEYENDLETYLDKGLTLSIEESGNVQNKIEDALSFYPIKGVLQALSEKIKDYYNENVG